MRPTISKIVSSSGLVLAVALSACSSDDGGGDADAADATDAEQTGSASAPTDESSAEADDESETATIGGDDTGLSLEIPAEWVEVPMDADTMSEGLDSLDLPDEQAAVVESSVGALGNLEGAVMAIDSSALGASVATNVNAYCVANDGSVGESNLEAAIELGLEAIAADIGIEEASVDGMSAVRATYSLDMGQVQGHGVQYMFLSGDDVCWVTFTGTDESQSGMFDEIAATIRVL